ncbi:hypothetical protein [Propionicicella superfundia]|uniref:hypothetical protein n=1 Tax=Propionicicella superfundia TaxID=348582 RepID=UPI0006847A65|nr:hypothetical protein [Propionicicella superfundia]
MCGLAEGYWQSNTLAAGQAIVLVDLLYQDVRVAIRVLTMAASLQRDRHVRLVGLVGPDKHWRDEIWGYYDVDRLKQLAQAYGVEEFIDLGRVVEDSLEGSASFTLGGEEVLIPGESGISRQTFSEIAEATQLRALRIPKITPEVLDNQEYRALQKRCEHFSRVWDALMQLDVVAFVASHIDYHQWGFGVEAAMRHGVEIYHLQSTGSFKAYALFPEMLHDGYSARMVWTEQIADFFEEHVWPAREILARSAELTAYRSKTNQGRPSWWRGGGSVSHLDFSTPEERDSIRSLGMAQLGLDSRKPVVAVFNHAVSDAVHSNYEVFDNLADWFDATLRFAAGHPEVNWLLVDHPAQAHYDGTEWFERLAEEYDDVDHMAFISSMDVSKNVMWSLVDTAVTVRGSVSNEFPAYGVPAIQAGWSEWSHCGFSQRADTQDEYWQLLNDNIAALLRGETLISEEQVMRARLWLWFYRAGADVASPIVPHWEMLQGVELHQNMSVAFGHVEADADAALVAVRRLLQRRDPLLTRVDFHVDVPALADSLGVVDHSVGAPGCGVTTVFDNPAEPLELPGRVESGQDPSLVVVDGFARGQAVVGRAVRGRILLGIKTGGTQRDLIVTAELMIDVQTHRWYAERHPDAEMLDSRGPRCIRVRCHDAIVAGVVLVGERTRQTITFRVPAAAVDDGSLLLIEFSDAAEGEPGATTDPLCGVCITAIDFAESREASEERVGAITYDDRVLVPGTPLMGVAPGGSTLRFRVVDSPRVTGTATGVRGNLARAKRKVELHGRRALRRALPLPRLSADSVSATAWASGGEAHRVAARFPTPETCEVKLPSGEGDAPVTYFRLSVRSEALSRAGYSRHVRWERVRL